MIFSGTPLAGVAVIEAEPIPDHRGHFARVWCGDEFGEAGLTRTWAQANIQFSPRVGTLRGMHFQLPPHDEVKLVRCTRGAVYDVAIDLRDSSPTYRQWFGVELSATNYRTMWVPEGCAHGFVTLEPDSEVLYMTSKPFAAGHATGIRHDDPAVDVEWPVAVEVISDRDATWPLLDA